MTCVMVKCCFTDLTIVQLSNHYKSHILGLSFCLKDVFLGVQHVGNKYLYHVVIPASNDSNVYLLWHLNSPWMCL